MKRARYVLTLTALTVLNLFPILGRQTAVAATFKQDGDRLRIEGEIVKGDLAKLLSILDKPGQSIRKISLNSNGGNFAEGLHMAVQIRKAGVGTIVESSSTCNSACALIFLGGATPEGEGEDEGRYPDRTLQIGAKLGFHAPYVPDAVEGKPIEPSKLGEAQAAFFDIASDLDAKLSDFGVPDSLRPQIKLNLPDHRLYDATTVEAVELLAIQVDAKEIYQPNAITKSMAVNSCLNNFSFNQTPPRLPSNQTRSAMASYTKISQQSDLRVTDEGALIPAAYLGNSSVGVCKIGRDGSYEGYHGFVKGLLYDKEEALLLTSDHVRPNPASLDMVPPETLLTDVSRVLQQMESSEQAIFTQVAVLPSLQQEELPPKVEPSQGFSPRKEFICNTNAGYANVRTGPNSKLFGVVAKLTNREPITLIAEANNPETGHKWYKIEFSGQSGFVDSEMVGSSCLVAVVPSNVGSAGGYQPRDVVVCNRRGDSLNVRSGPNPKVDGVLHKLFNGEALTIIGETHNPDSGHLWFKVKANGSDGFVDSELVSTSCDQRAGSIESSLEAVVCNSATDFANLRSGPNKDLYEIVLKVNNGQPIRVLQKTANPVTGHPWLRIVVDGVEGFVDAEMVASTCG